jgi:biopolymer transport protein ExbB/TolQ
MAMKPSLTYLVLMAAGTVVWIAILLVVLRFHPEADTAAQLASKAQRVELVSQMRLDLASASEAGKSAVMATTDQNSQVFADQARAATAAVERGRREVEELLQTRATKNEEELLAQFSQAFAEFRRIDRDVLEMAVRNTNLKAYSLAFGPAAEVLNEMDAALSRIVAQNVNSASPDVRQVMQLADDARIRALHIQTLLAPHIAEESGGKMDELEALMAKDDVEVHKDLAGLAALLKSTGNPDLEIASSRYTQFSEIKTQIIKLSRENTNVRSLVITLNQERKVMLTCQDALAALEQAIQQEPVVGRKTPVLPR